MFRAVQHVQGNPPSSDLQVALQDAALINVFDALEISVADAWNLFRTLDSAP